MLPGRTFNAFSVEAARRVNRNRDACMEYVVEIKDEREDDMERSRSEQVGIVISICNEGLLKPSVSAPSLGVDEAFAKVSPNNSGVELEVAMVVAKDLLSGRIYPIFRIIATRKRVAPRRVMFN